MTTIPPAARISVALLAAAAAAAVGWWAAGNRHAPRTGRSPDATLVQQLLAEDLGSRRFPFPVVVKAASGHAVLPLRPDDPAHARVTRALGEALDAVCRDLSSDDSPVRSLRRINEASRFFEDGLRERLDAVPGLRCEIPTTRRGDPQRSGYPDLRIVDEAGGTVFYLDPKLVERAASASTLRTFYFEPKDETLKITDDAVHLLAGIEHDGRDGAWTFGPWRLVDLAALKVRLKAEFQASNADLYQPPAN